MVNIRNSYVLSWYTHIFVNLTLLVPVIWLFEKWIFSTLNKTVLSSCVRVFIHKLLIMTSRKCMFKTFKKSDRSIFLYKRLWVKKKSSSKTKKNDFLKRHDHELHPPLSHYSGTTLDTGAVGDSKLEFGNGNFEGAGLWRGWFRASFLRPFFEWPRNEFRVRPGRAARPSSHDDETAVDRRIIAPQRCPDGLPFWQRYASVPLAAPTASRGPAASATARHR